MFSMMSTKMMITLALVALIVVGSCRMMKMAGCNRRKPRPPKIHQVTLVGKITADTGASLTVVTEVRRRTKELKVILKGIAAPMIGSEWADTSRKHLEEMAGGWITVKYEKRGLIRSDDPQVSRLDDAAVVRSSEIEVIGEVQPEDVGVEARGPLIGVVYGESGILLQEAQVEGGYARCNPEAPDDWKKAEAKAKKLKQGIWSENE